MHSVAHSSQQCTNTYTVTQKHSFTSPSQQCTSQQRARIYTVGPRVHEKLRRLKPPSSCRTPRHRNSRRDTLLSQEHSAPIIVTSETSVFRTPFRTQNCSATI